MGMMRDSSKGKSSNNRGKERRGESNKDEEEDDALKIHISRIPTKFNEEIVTRILKEQLIGTTTSSSSNNEGDSSENDQTLTVELIYPREEQEEDDNQQEGEQKDAGKKNKSNNNSFDPKTKSTESLEHRGFGFVTLGSQELYDKALELQTIKGGRKPNSTKLKTMYLRPYATQEEEDNRNVCYLWSQRRCPYGDECKFTHSGEGACIEKKAESSTKKKGKCFAYKKGKCNKGDECPFSHDFAPTCTPATSSTTTDDATETKPPHKDIPTAEKDCINWKTKGKCRKGDKCPYRHNPEWLEKVQAKKNKRKATTQPEPASGDDNNDNNKRSKKQQGQPICIRVFGMSYETTESDIRTYFQDCGKIPKITFPTFPDSGRSKGYCEVWFTSPKAVTQAIALDGQELHGRWLSVQAGKMYLKEWEAQEQR